MDQRELLTRVPLFRELSPDDLQRVLDATRPVAFEPGTEIVTIGDPGHALYIVTSGVVQILYPARSAEFELARLGSGECFGEMALLNEKPRSATVRAVDRVEALALARADFDRVLMETPRLAVEILGALSQRIRNADEQISGLSDQALRDSLTNLLNRRAFHERLHEECDRFRRYGDGFALILLDLDRFKAINDTMGHDVGDEVLAWVGRMLAEHTRAADACFRVGGEEFAVLCPSTGPDVAGKAAQRLVAVVAEARPPLREGGRVHVTMSAGFSACPDHARRPEFLFQVADQALLRAKAEGRDRVVAPAIPTP
ncbi:MAG: GGDEF domain-containing protein [Gemmatimonadetes bacterium]|nr:GGDEF domain-containing protein [Gemmatimonadota bacterium]